MPQCAQSQSPRSTIRGSFGRGLGFRVNGLGSRAQFQTFNPNPEL